MGFLKYFNRSLKYPLSVSFYFLLAGWTVVIFGIAFWSYNNIYDETVRLALREAYKGYEKDVMFRSWATMHGGVYVPVSDKTQPNLYLSQTKERDVLTPSGRKLTLMNPAYITRQVHELSYNQIGIRGHITSLRPIRLANSPDAWEVTALKSFERGSKEHYGFDLIKNQKYFRYMAPLVTEKGCLKCHATQGYNVGDIRGGISSTVPWANYQKSINSQLNMILLGYGIIWIIGFVGISIVKNRFIIYITRRDLYEEEMKDLNGELLESKKKIEDALVERNKYIDELMQLNKKLEKISSEKDKFFSIIAHDLKNPFSGFIGLTEMMADESQIFSKEQMINMSKDINSSANNLFQLLQNLLEWSQMQRGAVKYEPGNTNLLNAVLHNIEFLKHHIEHKQLHIRMNIEPHMEVYADQHMINSILRNLLGNAIKFTNHTGAISISAVEVENDFIRIAIQDTGIGMPESIFNNLFKLEAKIGRTGTDGEKSSGLGLLLCKEFVEAHGGKIWAESEDGIGTIFYLTLPK